MRDKPIMYDVNKNCVFGPDLPLNQSRLIWPNMTYPYEHGLKHGHTMIYWNKRWSPFLVLTKHITYHIWYMYYIYIHIWITIWSHHDLSQFKYHISTDWNAVWEVSQDQHAGIFSKTDHDCVQSDAPQLVSGKFIWSISLCFVLPNRIGLYNQKYQPPTLGHQRKFSDLIWIDVIQVQ